MIKGNGFDLGSNPQVLPAKIADIPVSSKPTSITALNNGTRAYAALGNCTIAGGVNHLTLPTNVSSCPGNLVSVIDAVGSGHTAALPQPYTLARAILEKTMEWQVVPDDLQIQAVTQWGKRGLVEIVVLSGFYQMFAAINQGFDIRPAPGPL